ncbi:MAG: fimbria major subunit [Proteiniphilum sp.]|nr:fimbria major subunit [Proteiniphilum sp.]
MKLRNLFLAAMVAIGMVACNNEEVPQVNGAEATISIKVMPTSNGSGTRAIGDLSSANATTSPGLTAESTVHSLEVWVFLGDVLDAYKSASGYEVAGIPAHVGTRTIVVAANTTIGSQTSLNTLKGLLQDLPPANISTGGLIMTAEPFDVTLNKGNNYYGYTDNEVDAKTGVDKNHLNDSKKPLPITRVNARVAIVSAVLDYTNVPENQKVAFDALKDVEVAMFNVPKQTKLFGTNLATNTAYQFGAKWDSPNNTYVGANDPLATANTVLFNQVTGALPVVNTAAPYYYVNESNGSDKMFIVLRAKVYKGNTAVTNLNGLFTDADGFTYYPVWVNKDGLTENGNIGNSNVYRNTQYNITLTIKGLGNPNIDEVENAWLDVQVAVEDWKVVDQNVTWN